MGRLFIQLAMTIAVLAIAIGFTHAAEATTAVDFGPAATAIIEWLAPMIAALVVAFGSWVASKLASLLGLKITAMQRATIDHGLDRGIGYAISRLSDRAAGGIPVKFKNEAVAMAADYAMRAIPDALKYFRKGRSELDDMIESRLEGLLVDPDNPTTMPTVRATAGPLGP